MDWQPFEGGSTIGAVGSEDGTIVRDDEHPLGARITLELGCRIAPYTITCGIYGSMFHTVFLDEAAGHPTYDAIRERLTAILHIDCQDKYEEYINAIEQIVSDFP